MGAVYAICSEYEIPHRKGQGFSLLRVGEDGMTHGEARAANCTAHAGAGPLMIFL